MKTIQIDYNHCLTNLTNSILKHYNIPPYHNTIQELDNILNEKDYQNIVLILYDGMGSNLLKRNLSSNSFLNTHKLMDIHAVFPPTTTASTTSILSGLNPSNHGWLGWDLYFKEEQQTVTMFLNTLKDTEIQANTQNLAQKYYSYTSILDLLKPKVNTYKLQSFEKSFKDLNDMNQKIITLCNQKDKKFIYAYYDEPDHTLHELGTSSKETIELFEKINQSTQELCQNLKNTLVIVIADHGHIDSEPITLSDYPDIFNLLSQDISIEARACNFFIKNDQLTKFEDLFNKYFSKWFKLYSKAEVINDKLFGNGPEHPRFQESLGDYLAVAISNKYFRYNDKSVLLKSMHAGITEDEVLVPLIIYKS